MTRPRPRGPRLGVAGALLALGLLSASTPVARADVYYLRDGDRISGRTIAEGTRGFRVQTPAA